MYEFQVGSDSPSIDQSDSDRSRLFFDQSIEGEDGGTLVGLESPTGPKMAGGTPTLGLGSSRSKLYTRQGWKKPQDEPNKFLPLVIESLSLKMPLTFVIKLDARYLSITE